jgi:hypothetical protein
MGEDLRRLRGPRVQHLALGATSNLNAPLQGIVDAGDFYEGRARVYDLMGDHSNAEVDRKKAKELRGN